MISNKVLITYKRKRLSANAKPAILKSDSSVKVDGEHCFRCGNVDVNENLLVCHSCFGSYHLRCIESSSEYVPEDSWLCSTCTEKCDTEVPLLLQFGKIIENEIVGEPEMGLMKLGDQRVLLNSRSLEEKFIEENPSLMNPTIKRVNNIKDNLGADFGSTGKVVKETSGFLSSNLESVGRSTHIDLNTWTETDPNSRFSESVASVVSLDKKCDIVVNDDCPKENTKTRLITFHRRVKKKQKIDDESITRYSRDESKQSQAGTHSHELGGSCRCVGSTVVSDLSRPNQLQDKEPKKVVRTPGSGSSARSPGARERLDLEQPRASAWPGSLGARSCSRRPNKGKLIFEVWWSTTIGQPTSAVQATGGGSSARRWINFDEVSTRARHVSTVQACERGSKRPD